MTKRIRTVLLLFCAAASLPAQTDEEMQAYLLGKLNGNEVQIQSKKLSQKKIADMRSRVWKAWIGANASFDGQTTLQLVPLSESSTGKWQLPSDLEPNATMPYYFGTKGEQPEGGYPLYLYLHGSGPKDQEWATGLKLAQRFEDAPSAYFIPQIPNEGEWYRWWQRSKQHAWDKLLRQTLLLPQVNPNKIYVFGISEGGYGSQRLASFYADYWAAAGPMAGGEPLKNAPAENLYNIGFSLRTGAEDKGFYRNILTRYVKEELDSLENLHSVGFRHKVTLIPGMGHHIDYSPTTPWLRLFTRNPRPSHYIWEDYEMDGLHRRGFYNLVVKKRPDENLRTRYDVVIGDSNVIDITVDNVEYKTTQTDPVYGIEMKFSRSYTPASGGEFTLYLDERQVKTNNSIKVKVNGRVVFYKTVHPSATHMLESVATFYDPERIFPIGIDVKY